MSQDAAVLLDRTLETEKGTVRIKIDIRTMMELLEEYTDKLIAIRGLPFDLDNLSSSDELVMLASRLMTWEKDPKVVFMTAYQHYAKLIKDAKRDAAILASTVDTEDMDFDPTPYEQPKQKAAWDFSLPIPTPNINHPTERRLKQILDVIYSDVNGQIEFMNSMNTVWIKAERRLSETDRDGFQQGSTGEPVPEEAVTPSLVTKKTGKRSGVAGV